MAGPALFRRVQQTFVGNKPSAVLPPQQPSDLPSQLPPSLASSVPTAVSTLPPLDPSANAVPSSFKEQAQPSISLERPAMEQVPGLQYVENEPQNHELSPELESFIQKVEDHHDQFPHEVVIAGTSAPIAPTPYLSKPAIVLPITPQIEKEGERKSPQFSVRWLVEWSHKVLKMFSGKVVYRTAVQSS